MMVEDIFTELDNGVVVDDHFFHWYFSTWIQNFEFFSSYTVFWGNLQQINEDICRNLARHVGRSVVNYSVL